MITRRNTAVHVLIITLILFGIAWYFMSTLTFFSNDNGLRFLQIQELVKNNGSSFAISYPSRNLDPDWVYTPFYYAYSIINDELFFQISSFLPMITAVLYPILGTLALPLIPVAGSVLTGTAVFYMGKMIEVKRPYLLLWSTIFATPMLFYSFELWDHSIAVACAMWATAGFAHSLQTNRWQPAFWGGLALGIGFGQRPEIYVYAIALGLAALFLSWKKWQNIAALVVGSSLTTLIIWFLQWRWVGHPLGMSFAPHLFGYGVKESYTTPTAGHPRTVTLSRFILYVQGQDEIIFIAALLILLGIFLTVFSVRIPRWQKSGVLWLSFGMTIVGSIIMIGRTWGQPLPGILSTFPIIALSLIYIDKKQDKTSHRPIYLLALITVFLFLGMMIAFWPASGGSQWGARYLLPVYPLFIFLSFYVIMTETTLLSGNYLKTFQRVAVGLLLATILFQAYSVTLLYRSHQSQIGLRRAIDDLSAEVILTNNPFLPSFMVSLEDKHFLYMNSSDEFQTLIPRLSDENIDRFALITVESMPISVPTQVDDIRIDQVDTLIYTLEQMPELEAPHE